MEVNWEAPLPGRGEHDGVKIHAGSSAAGNPRRRRASRVISSRCCRPRSTASRVQFGRLSIQLWSSMSQRYRRTIDSRIVRRMSHRISR
jgi:hypothetical protein